MPEDPLPGVAESPQRVEGVSESVNATTDAVKSAPATKDIWDKFAALSPFVTLAEAFALNGRSDEAVVA